MLLITAKYISGNRHYGLGFHLDYLIPPFLTSTRPVRYVYIDEIRKQNHFEEEVEKVARDEDVIVIGSVASKFLTRAFFSGLKRGGKKIVVFYGESYRLWSSYKNYRIYEKHYWYHDKIAAQKRMGTFADVIVQFDQPRTDYPDRTIFHPGFQSPHHFFPTATNGKTIDVSFVGSRDRPERLEYIKACPGIVVAGGGFGVDRIGLDVYADMMRSSKLSLQVGRSLQGQDILNGRMTQILWSRSALMCTDGPNVRHFFEPGVDFIPLESPRDFADKARYYLDHEEEREEIAYNGWKKATETYSFEKLWAEVEARLAT